MRFKQYLIEKTNKKEFESSLKNKNIIAGCEFEFYLNQNIFNIDIDIETPEFKKIRNQLENEISQVDSALEDYIDEISNINDKEQKITDEIIDLEEKIDTLDDEITDLEIDQIGVDKDTKITKQIEDNKKLLYKLKDKFENLQEELDDYNDNVLQDIAYDDFINNSASTYTLHSLQQILNLLQDSGWYEEEINSDYINQKLFEYSLENQETIDNVNNLFTVLYNYNLDDLIYDLENNSENIDNIDIPTEDDIMNLNFPINMNQIQEITEDGSLGPGGVEIVTNQHQVGDLVDVIDEVFDWIDDVGYVNNDCGFHVHMSMKTKNEIDPLKLLLFIEEGRIFQDFQNRVSSNWAESIKKGHFDKLETLSYSDVISIAKKEKIDKKMNTEKYLGVHLIDLEQNHVEFRYMGGFDYHKKFHEVKEVIANYAHWISIACDPDYKKKEYILKVNKMTNHFNYLYLSQVIKTFNSLVDNDIKNQKIKLNIINKLRQKILKPVMLQLKSIPKPSNKIKINKNLQRCGNNVAEKLFKNKYIPEINRFNKR